MAEGEGQPLGKRRFHIVEGVRVSLDVSYKVSTALPRVSDVYARHLRRHERGSERNSAALAAHRIKKHSQRWRPDAQWELEDADAPMQCVEKSSEGQCLRQERLPCDENPVALICSKDNRPRPKKKLRRPMVSVVLDDVGVNTEISKRAIGLANKITLSFLPYAPNVKEQAEAAAAAGHELMLHMPMQPFGAEKDPGESVLRTDMSKSELQDRVRWAMGQFDGFVGVNNHMGSRFTSQALEGMETVLSEFQRRGMFYLDSLTASDSLGPTTAAQLGMPHASRDVFLDVEDHPEFVRKQLKELERLARRNNHAIAIGHPKDATLEALKEWLPTLERRGLKLVQLGETLTDTKKERRAEAASIVLAHMRQQHALSANAPPPVTAPAPEASTQTTLTRSRSTHPSATDEAQGVEREGEVAVVTGGGPSGGSESEPPSWRERMKVEIARRQVESAAMDERRKAHATASPSVTVTKPKVLPARPGPMSGRAARDRTPLSRFVWRNTPAPPATTGPEPEGPSLLNLAMPLARPASELFKRLIRPSSIPRPEPTTDVARSTQTSRGQTPRASSHASPWPFSRMQSPLSRGQREDGQPQSPLWLPKSRNGRSPVLRPGKAITERATLELPDLGLRVRTGLPFDDDEDDSFSDHATAQPWTTAGTATLAGTPEGDPVLWHSSNEESPEGTGLESGSEWGQSGSSSSSSRFRGSKGRKAWKLRPPMRPLRLQGYQVAPLDQVWRLEPGLGIFPIGYKTNPSSAKCLLLDLLAGASQNPQLQELRQLALSSLTAGLPKRPATLSSRAPPPPLLSNPSQESSLSDSNRAEENPLLLSLAQTLAYPHPSPPQKVSLEPLGDPEMAAGFAEVASSGGGWALPAVAEVASSGSGWALPAVAELASSGGGRALPAGAVVASSGGVWALPGGDCQLEDPKRVEDGPVVDVLAAEGLRLGHVSVSTGSSCEGGLLNSWARKVADEEDSPNTVLANLRASIGSSSIGSDAELVEASGGRRGEDMGMGLFGRVGSSSGNVGEEGEDMCEIADVAAPGGDSEGAEVTHLAGEFSMGYEMGGGGEACGVVELSAVEEGEVECADVDAEMAGVSCADVGAELAVVSGGDEGFGWDKEVTGGMGEREVGADEDEGLGDGSDGEFEWDGAYVGDSVASFDELASADVELPGGEEVEAYVDGVLVGAEGLGNGEEVTAGMVGADVGEEVLGDESDGESEWDGAQGGDSMASFDELAGADVEACGLLEEGSLEVPVDEELEACTGGKEPEVDDVDECVEREIVGADVDAELAYGEDGEERVVLDRYANVDEGSEAQDGDAELEVAYYDGDAELEAAGDENAELAAAGDEDAELEAADGEGAELEAADEEDPSLFERADLSACGDSSAESDEFSAGEFESCEEMEALASPERWVDELDVAESEDADVANDGELDGDVAVFGEWDGDVAAYGESDADLAAHGESDADVSVDGEVDADVSAGGDSDAELTEVPAVEFECREGMEVITAAERSESVADLDGSPESNDDLEVQVAPSKAGLPAGAEVDADVDEGGGEVAAAEGDEETEVEASCESLEAVADVDGGQEQGIGSEVQVAAPIGVAAEMRMVPPAGADVEDGDESACSSDDESVASEGSVAVASSGGFAAISLPSGETAVARVHVAPSEEPVGLSESVTEKGEEQEEERRSALPAEVVGKAGVAGKKAQGSGKSVVNWLWRGGAASNTSSRVAPCPPDSSDEGTNDGAQ